jgi:hypothetical protein
LRYFITFACYGGHLPGAESDSVDRHHNLPGSRLLEAQLPGASKDATAAILAGPPAHVRINHVHAVVEAGVRPERLMNEFKSYASRELNRLDRDGPDRKRWARHGSTRWLWNDQDVQKAIQYVIEEQGEPMALFVAEGL